MSELRTMLRGLSDRRERLDPENGYDRRHNIQSAEVLTVLDDEAAAGMAAMLAPRIRGRTVIDVGGGFGLLALHMGRYAKQVFCIEGNPMWSWAFAAVLLKVKPKNVSYLYGAADEFFGHIKGDVAVICSHSAIPIMEGIARQFCPVVIDIYGEMIAANPGAFDAAASAMRWLYRSEFEAMSPAQMEALARRLGLA